MNPTSRISLLRQRLAQLASERQAAERVLLDRPALLKGTFSEVRRTCGNPGCKCARGEKHLCRQLSASVAGKTRTWNVPQQYAAKVKRLTQSYRRFRRARAAWVKVNERMLKLIGELEAARTVTDFLDEPGGQKG
jgi:hypothetical protein